MLKLTDEEKLYIEKNNHQWVTINGTKYFVKKHMFRMLYSEIAAEKIAQLLGVNCAHYEATLIRGQLFYLSKDLNSEGLFVNGEELPTNFNTLYECWNILEKNYGNDINVAVNDLVKIYIFDILLMNDDRHSRNWALINNTSGIHIYAFDNESILSNDFTILRSRYSRSESLRTPYDWSTYNDHVIKENMLELEYFLKTSTNEYYLLVEDMVNKLTPEVFAEILDNIEQEYQDKILNKSKWLKIYADNYNAIRTLLEARGKDGKRIH